MQKNILIYQILLKITDSVNLKSDTDKLDDDKLKNVLTNFSNLKTTVDKLDVDKLVPVPANLSKLSNLVKNVAAKKDVYSTKIKNIEPKIPDITNTTTNTNPDAKIKQGENEIPSITNSAKRRLKNYLILLT